MGMRREPNFVYLLVALVCFLLFGPVTTQLVGELDGLVLLLTLNTTLIIGIFSFQTSRALFVTGACLALTTVLITLVDLLEVIEQGPLLQLLGLAILLIFLGMSIVLANLHLLSPGSMSFNRILGGACTYLMLGLIWAILYTYIHKLDPASFNGAIITESSSPFWNLTYFSFVTMASLGYGDITPIHPLARVLAYLQAVTGQLYIAILIGAMVGSYVSSRPREAD